MGACEANLPVHHLGPSLYRPPSILVRFLLESHGIHTLPLDTDTLANMRFSTFGSMLFFASTIAALSVPSIPLDTHVKRDGNLDVGPIEANIQLLLRERLGRDAQLWELLRSVS